MITGLQDLHDAVGVVSRRQLVSSTVDTFRHDRNREVDFAGVFDNEGHGMAVVNTRTTSQRVRVALVTSSPPRMPLEVFARLPFGTPQS